MSEWFGKLVEVATRFVMMPTIQCLAPARAGTDNNTMPHRRLHRLLPALLLALSLDGRAADLRPVAPQDKAAVAARVPMIVAASSGDVTGMQKLLAAGVALDERDIVGNTPLIFAARYGRLPLVEFLLRRGAAVNAQTASGATALDEAVRRPSLAVVQALLDAGADVNLRDNQQRTTLYIAVGYQSLPIVNALLVSGGDIGAADEKGDTPLMRAVDLGLTAIVTALLDSAQNRHAAAHLGAALCAAERHRHDEIAGVLKAHGAVPLGAGCTLAALH